ncbi:MarC family protein [Celerinatantimonas sp. YJH-8]|uniref:MarC family protein n=1 Tax=Celerinatantimonas sp. YJH-8 TaxID=3228714 RepID=UPI0038C5C602
MVIYILNICVKFFFMCAPFFVLSTYIAITRRWEDEIRRKLAIKVIIASILMCLIVYIGGDFIFSLFGINIHSFRIGTGIILLLTAIQLASGADGNSKVSADVTPSDVIVVPLTTPVVVGPAVLGALVVMAADAKDMTTRVADLAGIILAMLLLGVILYLSATMERLITKQGISVMTKISGLVLSAIAAQMIMTGVSAFIH